MASVMATRLAVRVQGGFRSSVLDRAVVDVVAGTVRFPSIHVSHTGCDRYLVSDKTTVHARFDKATVKVGRLNTSRSTPCVTFVGRDLEGDHAASREHSIPMPSEADAEHLAAVMRDAPSPPPEPSAVAALRAQHPILWHNPDNEPQVESAFEALGVDARARVKAAHERWEFLRPAAATLLGLDDGRVQSPLWEVQHAEGLGGGRTFLKGDSELPLSGSVADRAAVFAVMARAGAIAHRATNAEASGAPAAAAGMAAGERFANLLRRDDAKAALGRHRLVLASTGNLGVAASKVAARLGLRAEVHVPAAVAEWRKQALHQAGAHVVEHHACFRDVVGKARELARGDEHAVLLDEDDDNDQGLFLAYASAAEELASQLQSQSITISAKQPLACFLPCDAPVAATGICWGLKAVFGANAHVYFVEPTGAPAVALGLATRRFEDIHLHEIGLDGSCAGGSALVFREADRFVSGIFTANAQMMHGATAQLFGSTKQFFWPSSAATFMAVEGVRHFASNPGLANGAVSVVWVCEGGKVPQEVRDEVVRLGQDLVRSAQQAGQ